MAAGSGHGPGADGGGGGQGSGARGRCRPLPARLGGRPWSLGTPGRSPVSSPMWLEGSARCRENMFLVCDVGGRRTGVEHKGAVWILPSVQESYDCWGRPILHACTDYHEGLPTHIEKAMVETVYIRTSAHTPHRLQEERRHLLFLQAMGCMDLQHSFSDTVVRDQHREFALLVFQVRAKA